MTVRELIATHSNTDFDGFAAMVAAQRLYPRASIALGGAVNRNVREFQALHADLVPVVGTTHLDLDAVERLVLVDTVHPNRLGDLSALCGRADVQVVAFDHHGEERPPFVAADQFVSSRDGSMVTVLLRLIAARQLPVSPFEAGVFALGIHEDTGSLTFGTTTAADAEALAQCMQLGADPRLLERWLANPLTAPQRKALGAALDGAEEIAVHGRRVLVAAQAHGEYVEGVSVVAHRLMDLTGADACLLLVRMEQRVFVTARSRGDIDVSAVLGVVGGGGHAAAASAVVRRGELDAVRARLVAALEEATRTIVQVADLIDAEPVTVEATESVDAALVTCRRRQADGAMVVRAGRVVGSVTGADLERAQAHDLGHAPVKAVMTGRLASAPPTASPDELARAAVAGGLGWVPIVDAGAPALPALTDVIGAVSRRAVAMGAPAAARLDDEEGRAGNVAARLAALELDDVLDHIQALATGETGVFLVGGAVRDLLLGAATVDVDVAVEGDGITFARRLAARLGGHARPHEKFGTAVVVAGEGAQRRRVDVASTRAESYAHPAALPRVQHAGIRHDLARRDFTINAMAVDLRPQRYGDLLDYFAGLADLEARRIVVLHNLSFIEDPTRILRAIRYESRYDLRMDEHTLNLARACSAMDLVGDLSSARLRDELRTLLDEERVDWSLRRLDALDLARAVHPRCRIEAETLDLVRRSDLIAVRHGLWHEFPRWRLRLMWLLRALEPEEITAWCRVLRVNRRDADALSRAMLVAGRVRERLARGPSEAELYELLRDQPLEAAVAAATLDAGGEVEVRLVAYLDHTRHVRLEIGGRDVLALGADPSPEVGRLLRSVLRLKLNGVVSGREQELQAVERLL